MKLLKPDCIIFDFDSTISTIEGIDELANLKNKKETVEKLTHQAMDGDIPLEKVYKKRLDIIKPSKKDIQQVAKLYENNLVNGISDLIEHLRNENIFLAIVSGGLKDAILPLAQKLGFQESDIFAVNIEYDINDTYIDVIDSPLIYANGKKEIVQKYKKQNQFKTIYLIGDGMSDIAAKGDDAADKVIGFGGVIARPKVKANADYFYDDKNIYNIKNFWE